MIWPGKKPSGAGLFSPPAQAIMAFRWWRARIFGATSVIYLSETVPASFAERLRGMGAEVVIEGADYEASMAAAEAGAVTRGATLFRFHMARA